MWLLVYVRTRESSRNTDSSALEPDRPAVCVIAQQYSSATFVSRFRSREENCGALSTQMLLFPFLLTFSNTVRSRSTLNFVSRRIFVSSCLFSCLPVYSRVFLSILVSSCLFSCLPVYSRVFLSILVSSCLFSCLPIYSRNL